MKILGFEITKTPKTALVPKAAGSNAVAIPASRNVWNRIYESYTGAWQHNVTVDIETIKTWHAIFACMTLIASDIAKLGFRLVEKNGDGVWAETENSAYSPVIRKPNRYQNRIQFWENWILSKLSNGNTYALKVRDASNKVRQLYILDPCRVQTMITPDGSVFYRLRPDNLSGLPTEVNVPASEIIHDRFNCLYHPLIGISPLVACGIAAMQGMAIQNNQTHFFNNRSLPSGYLTAPGNIEDATADRLKETWDTNFGGENAGKVAVMGDGLEFKTIAFTSVEAQVLEQLKWTAEVACSVFHVPGYKVGVGVMPATSSIQSLNLEYFTQSLQRLIEDAELCMDEGLELDVMKLGTEFDIDNLLRMDTVSQMDVLVKGAGIMKIDEMRKRINLGKVTGGNTVYLQQQNFSLEALAKRDAKADPFAGNAPKPTPTPPGETPPAGANDPAAAESKAFDRDRDPQVIANELQSALAA